MTRKRPFYQSTLRVSETLRVWTILPNEPNVGRFTKRTRSGRSTERPQRARVPCRGGSRIAFFANHRIASLAPPSRIRFYLVLVKAVSTTAQGE